MAVAWVPAGEPARKISLRPSGPPVGRHLCWPLRQSVVSHCRGERKLCQERRHGCVAGGCRPLQAACCPSSIVVVHTYSCTVTYVAGPRSELPSGFGTRPRIVSGVRCRCGSRSLFSRLAGGTGRTAGQICPPRWRPVAGGAGRCRGWLYRVSPARRRARRDETPLCAAGLSRLRIGPNVGNASRERRCGGRLPADLSDTYPPWPAASAYRSLGFVAIEPYYHSPSAGTLFMARELS